MANLFPSISAFLIFSNTGVNGVNPAWDNSSLSLILSIVQRMMVRALLQSCSESLILIGFVAKECKLYTG
jgi:hypothetical protein